MRLVLELLATADGRIEGSVACADTDARMSFSGWLELLRLLEARLATRSPQVDGS